MAVQLKKGQRVSLEKSVKYALVGLGWKTNSFDGAAFDLDASAFLTASNGKVKYENTDFVFYHNKEGRNKCVIHLGDNLVGSSGDKDDEQIKIDFTKVPEDIEHIALTVTIHDADRRKQNFGQVSRAYVRVANLTNFNDESGDEQIRYDLEEDFSNETAIVVAEFYKKDNEWRFKAVGAGFDGGLKSLCNNFGVEVSSD